MSRPKTKVLRIRVDEKFYDFLRDYARAHGFELATMARRILEYFHMGLLVGEFKRPFGEIKQDFLGKYNRPQSQSLKER